MPTEHSLQVQLRELFDSAAAKSLVVINQDDAEPEMARFLSLVKKNPDQRSFIVKLFIDSFGDEFHMHWPPWKFLQFCMHDLRWPELRGFIESKKTHDAQQHGARMSPVWGELLAAFEDGWEGAGAFKFFRNSKT